MEYLNLQVVLLVVGIAVILFVLWDSKRRKNNSPEELDTSSEEVEELFSQRDDSGFDILGVGLSRVITSEDKLVARRDEDIDIAEESLVASRDEPSSHTSQPAAEQPDLIITVTLLAKDEAGFNGEKLLHCMLSRGLRFGDMNIFHRHKHTSGEGPVQFSLANALKPGIFNLDDMDSFKTRAVTLFMLLPGPREPIKAYELMLDTAQHLSTEMNAQLLDETRSVLTQQTIQHYKDQIVDYQRKHQA